MVREFTCIICPNGCQMTVRTKQGEIEAVEGAGCPRGDGYVRQELTAPKRNIATSVLVEGGELPLASVRLTAPIPREKIAEAMEVIRKVRVTAPVTAGTVVIKGLMGYDSDVIITKDVGREEVEDVKGSKGMPGAV